MKIVMAKEEQVDLRYEINAVKSTIQVIEFLDDGELGQTLGVPGFETGPGLPPSPGAINRRRDPGDPRVAEDDSL
jgi:hypothetical protein